MRLSAKFVAKADRLSEDQACRVRDAFFNLELPSKVMEELLAVLLRYEVGGVPSDWHFNMISPSQCLLVWNAIDRGREPRSTRRVFDYVLTHLEPGTGFVTLSREEIAELVGILPKHVSSAMTRLENLGAITRERVKIPGLKGPGMVRYRINPNVGWNGKLEKREVLAQAAPTELRVVAGKDFPAPSATE